jgi:hypothetical protein
MRHDTETESLHGYFAELLGSWSQSVSMKAVAALKYE